MTSALLADWNEWKAKNPSNEGRERCFELSPSTGWRFIGDPLASASQFSHDQNQSPSPRRTSKRRKVGTVSSDLSPAARDETSTESSAVKAAKLLSVSVPLRSETERVTTPVDASRPQTADSADSAHSAHSISQAVTAPSSPIIPNRNQNQVPASTALNPQVANSSEEQAVIVLTNSHQIPTSGVVIPDSQSQNLSSIALAQQTSSNANTIDPSASASLPSPPLQTGPQARELSQASQDATHKDRLERFQASARQSPSGSISNFSVDNSASLHPNNIVSPCLLIASTLLNLTMSDKDLSQKQDSTCSAGAIASSIESGQPEESLSTTLQDQASVLEEAQPDRSVSNISDAPPNEASNQQAASRVSSSLDLPPEVTTSSSVPFPSHQPTFILDSAAPPAPSTPARMTSPAGNPSAASPRSETPAHSVFSNTMASRLAAMRPSPGLGSPANASVKKDAYAEKLAKVDFLVAVPLYQHARTTLKSRFEKDHATISKYITSGPDEAGRLQPIVDKLLRDLHDLETHTDYIEGDVFSQRSDAQMVAWTRSISVKLRFLHHVLSGAAEAPKRLAIFVKPGRMLDCVDSFLNLLEVNYSRPDQNRQASSTSGGLIIDLLPTKLAGMQSISDSPDLVIGLDETFDLSDPEVVEFRRNISGDVCPAVKLIPIWGVEHIVRSVDPELSPGDQTREILRKLQILQDHLGVTRTISSSGQAPVKECRAEPVADAFALWLNANSAAQLGCIVDISKFDVDSKVAEVLGIVLETGRGKQRGKRTHSDSENSTSSGQKRQKLDLLPAPRPAMEGLGSPPVPHRFRRVASEPARGPSKEIAGVQEELQAARRAEREMEVSLAALQTRFESLTASNAALHQTIKAGEVALQKQLETCERLEKSLVATKEERAALKAELRTASESLANSSVPELQEYAQIRQKAAHAESLEKRLANENNDAEYARRLYQDASHKAQESAAQVEQLSAEKDRLQKRCDAYALEHRQNSQDTLIKQQASALDRVKRELQQRERHLDQVARHRRELEEENRELRMQVEGNRGMRHSTRGASMRADSQGPAGTTGRSLLGAALNGMSSRPQSRAASRQGSPLLSTAKPPGQAHGPSGLRPL